MSETDVERMRVEGDAAAAAERRSGRALVIIPTYNERENVARIVAQVLEQDPRLDVLVVDDGSPDGTGAIVDALAAESPRVHALHRARKPLA